MANHVQRGEEDERERDKEREREREIMMHTGRRGDDVRGEVRGGEG